jgi:hypothetical protein
MSIVVPNNGEGIALANFANKTAPQDGVLCLFQNNVTPAETDVTSTYTEATFTGYSNQSIPGTGATVTEGAPSNVAWATKTFTSSADQTNQPIYGYYVKETTSGKVKWSERSATAPMNIAANGDNIAITPVITMD